MQHYEWQSDAPAPEEVMPWRAPDWAVYLVMAGVVAYLITGLAFAIIDSSGRVQVSGVMVPLSFVFEIFLWPAKFVMPALI
ncbi:MAG: hypothetical protein ACTHJM_05555 [Marmoricola sp.]